MRRDEQRSKHARKNSQAEKVSSKDVEFSWELADEDDKEAFARSRAAERRVKEED